MRFYLLSTAFTVLLNLVVTEYEFATANSIDAEDQIERIPLALRNISLKIKSIEDIQNQSQRLNNHHEGELIFNQAKNFFEEKDHWASLYWFNRYLKVSPNPPLEKYLSAVHLMFYAASSLGEYHLAFRYAQNFINQFSSSREKQFTKIIGILRTINRYKSEFKIDEGEKRSFLSAILAINYPQDIVSEVTYITAKIARSASSEMVALRLAKSSSSAQGRDEALNEEKRIRSIFFSAIVAAKNNDLKRSRELLQPLSDSLSKTTKLSDPINLTLARIYFKLSKLDLAKKYYIKIPRSSKHFHDKVYELCFLFTERKEWTSALQEIETFESIAPETSKKRLHLVSLKPFLLQKNGQDNSATNLLKESIISIDQLAKKINSRLIRPKNVIADDFFYLEDEINQTFPRTVLSNSLRSIKSDIHNSKLALMRIKSQFHEELFSIATHNLKNLLPAQIMNFSQMIDIGSELFDVAKIITDSQFHLYQEKLTPIEISKEHLYREYRENAAKKSVEFTLKNQSWRLEQVFWSRQNMVRTIWQNLQDELSIVNGFSHRLKSENSKKDRLITEKKIKRFIEQIELAKNNLIQISRDLSLSRLSSQSQAFKQMSLKNQTKMIYQSYIESESLYSNYTNSYQSLLASESADRLSRIWIIWKKTYQNLISSFDKIEAKVHLRTRQTSQIMKQYFKKIEALENKHGKIHRRFIRNSPKIINQIARTYLENIDQRKSTYRSLIADIKWKDAKQEKLKQTRIQDKFEIDFLRLESEFIQHQDGLLL